MGFFSFLSSKKQLSQREIREKLLRVSSLTQTEREAVMEALKKFQGGGGVSAYELKRGLDELRSKYTISDFDRRKIIDTLFGE